jgi:hypothetical protein
VAASSQQPYLSAINRFLGDHARPPMALGPMITRVRKELANFQQDLAPTPERVPIPAPIALAILLLSEKLLVTVHWDHSDQRLPLLRACIASVASYMFFNRGECSATALSNDLIGDDAHITLRLRNEKGHKARNKGQRSVRQIAVLDAPRPAAALAAYFTGTATLGHRKRRWALTPAKDATPWSGETLSGWLRAAFTATGHSPRRGFSGPRTTSARVLLQQQTPFKSV